VPRFCSGGKVIDFAFVTAYGLNNGYVGRVADHAGAVRAIAPNTQPHVCPRQGRRRPTPRFVPQVKSLISRLWRFTVF
jgi:hypothetical protein